ncbi:hypothetical protein [Streptomyces sp. FxanaA7]|uniref:hypothetical protein n=1 Tax=Streptomyces sp. FxanaA7 TaxID=1265492 RepID=UPI000698ABAE|nr:hypothetical protein [Streptomyces sp. FxanaA7]
MVTLPDTAPRIAVGDGWSLRPLDEPAGEPIGGPLGSRRSAARRYAAAHGDRGDPQEFLVHLQRVRHHPVRACYPFGAHDFVVRLGDDGDGDGDGDDGDGGGTEHGGRAGRAGRVPEAAGADLLRALVPALFAADARCRRVIAAPGEHDVHAQRVLSAGGFRRVTEADLPGGSVVLFAAEPPALTELSTALDDMPH